ncbi:TonB-dependent receptor [Dysgonomonas sp. Marseille-P4677]|uniref:SusC/RagA family TonB-linked outer membrane protein n=1 Tax=Dysgonomonas sp. Marseille-P4677 TaxID=2364790 RepID=UPI0019138361|nr:TonB-dependent receptor [Dysgonomonas sp. Marseille-P4677]MBK5720641.1 TonB-dependent receptor [Dysgonomonas sp. Marseille-P4677]
MLKVQIYKKGMTRTWVVLALLLLNCTLVFAQNKVTGRVVDNTGEPLVGVSIVEKGTTNGIMSDIDGNFSLNVAQGSIIQLSFIGFKTQEIKATSSFMSVILEGDDNFLDEVIVVGYGKMTRKDLTSSITTIKADELNKGGVYTSPGQLLQGKVPGLTITTSSNPTATPSLTLRGASSFRGGEAQEPYYVIDGIPGASIALVAPDDIESIDVLRDASATAIYGSKAANGVIIITTKKGNSGAANVTYSAYMAVDQVSNRWELLDAEQHRKILDDNGLTLGSSNYIDKDTNTNWQKEVQRTGFSHNHNISILGGSEKTNYSVSLNYLDNKGIIKNSELDRTTARMNLNTKTLENRLDLGFSLNASITNSKYIQAGNEGLNVLDAMTYYLPESPVYNKDGSYFENLDNGQYYNPVGLLNQNSDDVRRKRIQGIGTASLHLIPEELVLSGNLSYQSDNENISRYNDIKSKVKQNVGGFALRYTNEDIQKNVEIYANYNKTLNNIHKIGFMLGYSWEERNTGDGFQSTDQYFSSDALGYYGLGTGSYENRIDYGSSSYKTQKSISFFGRANYSFNSKYLLQATIRRDGSSAFGENNRWGTFPSGSLAWRMNEENFIKNLNIFSDLKFRIGYGVSGNSLGFDPYISRVLYDKNGTFINSSGETVSAIGAVRNANPNLKWERTSMINVGLDFGFFNNRLTGTVEYYDKRTDDLIADYEVPTTEYLVSWLTTNVGEISNKGIEVTLNATPIMTDKFTWNTSLNVSHNKNKVVSLSNDNFAKEYIDKAELNAAGQTGAHQQRIVEGEPLGSFYTWKWAGYNENGISQFYTKDGGVTLTPSDQDRFLTGSAQPKLNFGWKNTLTYSNWTLDMFFTGIMGNDILNSSRASLSRVADITRRNMLVSASHSEKMTDTNSHFLSDRYIEKGDYLRLASLSMGYTFEKISKHIKNLRVYASCNNVFVITGYKGLDPEINLGGTEPGIDNRNFYPKTRTFMFGTSITF